VDDHVRLAEPGQLHLHDVPLGGLDDVREGHPRALEEGGLVQALARQGLVEEPVHALLQVEELLQGVAREGHGRF
jgi:hypothetical protein